MDDKERLNALEVALNNEARSVSFTSRTRRKRKPSGKTMFKSIAADELEHYARLKELHKAWEQQKNGLNQCRLQ